jgi:glycine oxidase
MDDILILGGGVIGLSLAYELAGRGLSVRVLDRASPGQEASWAGAGILPPAGEQDKNPLEQLTALSGKLHREWAARFREEFGIDNGYRTCGGLHVARSERDADALRITATNWQAVGIRIEWLESADVARLEPVLAEASPAIAVAVRLPDEAQIRNPWHLKALITACVARGVQLESGAAVEQFILRRGQIAAVETALGRRQAQRYVLASGSWTTALALQLGIRLNLRPIRGQMLLLSTPGPVLRQIVNDGSRYLVPRSDGRLLVGSTEEDVGFDKRNTTLGVSSLLELAQNLAPILRSATLERCWSGLRPCTGDGMPYLGPVPEIENAYVAAGHFRSGLTLSTGSAVVLAQHLCGEPSQVPLDAFTLSRDAKGAPLGPLRRA